VVVGAVWATAAVLAAASNAVAISLGFNILILLIQLSSPALFPGKGGRVLADL
jgi:hypothetical protein